MIWQAPGLKILQGKALIKVLQKVCIWTGAVDTSYLQNMPE